MEKKQKNVLIVVIVLAIITTSIGFIQFTGFYLVNGGNGGGDPPTEYDSLPSAPTLYSIEPDPDTVDSTISLEWGVSERATYYNIWRRYESIETKIKIGETGSSFVDGVTKENGKYYYRIEAVNNIGKVWSNEESVVINIIDAPDPPDVDPPDAPVLNMIASPSITGEIHISWSSVSDADDYGIYRSDNDDNYDLLEIVYTSSYDDSITEDGTYYYMVKAGNEGGYSDYSNVESVTVQIPGVPDVPEAYYITYEVVDSGVEITVSWSSVSCVSYKLYREIINNTISTGFVLIKEGLTSTSYSEVLTEVGKYTYKVSAINELGESDQSNPTSVNIGDDDAEPEDYTLLYVLLGVLGALVVPAVILTIRKKSRK